MNYEDIYSRFYDILGDDPKFFKLDEDEAYGYMRGWLHNASSEPYIRRIFDSFELDDDLMQITFSLKDDFGENDDSNNRFIINIFAQYLKISWMRKQIDNALNLAVVIGGKEEKRIQSNYKTNIDRVDSLEIKLKKAVRDHGYYNNSILNGEM